MRLDREKTVMQETGVLATHGLTLADAWEIVSDLGFDPREVTFEWGKLVSEDSKHGGFG